MNNHVDTERRDTKAHSDMSAVEQEHRHGTDSTEAGGKPRPLSSVVTFSHTHPNAPQSPRPTHSHMPHRYLERPHTHNYQITPRLPGLPHTRHPHTCASFKHRASARSPSIQAHGSRSCTQLIPCLLLRPPSFPPSQGWSKSGTKAQRPLLPFPPALPPLPPGVQPLCPPAAEPERESRQSGRDTGAVAARGTGCRTHRSGPGESSSCGAPGRGRHQVSARNIRGGT